MTSPILETRQLSVRFGGHVAVDHVSCAFHAGSLTAIVGPNGSGKSNVVDAMRWVLGEQSYSTLRSRKAEDLIFGGGPRRAPAGFAEVSLTIDNSDRTLPLAFDTVTITRRSTRSGEHEYFINKAKVRLRDIQEATLPSGARTPSSTKA